MEIILNSKYAKDTLGIRSIFMNNKLKKKKKNEILYRNLKFIERQLFMKKMVAYKELFEIAYRITFSKNRLITEITVEI